jgi:hypothetical protein
MVTPKSTAYLLPFGTPCAKLHCNNDVVAVDFHYRHTGVCSLDTGRAHSLLSSSREPVLAR